MCNCVCLLQDKEQARAVRAQRVAQAQQEREAKGAAADWTTSYTIWDNWDVSSIYAAEANAWHARCSLCECVCVCVCVVLSACCQDPDEIAAAKESAAKAAESQAKRAAMGGCDHDHSKVSRSILSCFACLFALFA